MNAFSYGKHFAARVARDPDTGCWIWGGARHANGYGRISHQNKSKLVHRFSYEWHVGPIPTGLQLDHLCRNRACCNPAHLEPVSGRTNVLRGDTITASNARKTHCPQGHPYTRIYAGKRRCLICNRAHWNAYRARRVSA